MSQNLWACENPQNVTQYSEVGCIIGDLATASKDGKYGFIDKTGKVVIPFQYADVVNFREDLAIVSQNGKWGVIDKKTNKIVIPIEYYSIKPTSDQEGFIVETLISVGYLVPVTETGYFYKLGTTFFHFTKFPFLSSNIEPVKQNGKWGVVDKTGKMIIPTKYNAIRHFGDTSWIIQEQNKKWGAIDETGKIFIPVQYDTFEHLINNTLYKVKQNGKFGIIDTKGNLIAPVQYDEIQRKKYIIEVKQNGKVGIYLSSGKLVIPVQYDKIEQQNSLQPFFKVTLNGETKLLKFDKKGNPIQ